MPYIKPEDRTGETLIRPQNAGELNWVLTTFCNAYIERNGKRYQTINEIVGVLECCKLEFYRRLAAPYEDEKIKENGDVY